MKKNCILCNKQFVSKKSYYDVCDECLIAFSVIMKEGCNHKERDSEKIELLR